MKKFKSRKKYTASEIREKNKTNQLRVVKEDIKTANKRLKKIYKHFGKERWASKKLEKALDIPKLEGIFNKKSGLVSTKNLNKLDNMQVLAVKKSLKNFLGYRTSTIKGINEAINEQRLRMRQAFEEFDDFVDDNKYFDAEILADYFNDPDFSECKDVIGDTNLVNLVDGWVADVKNMDDDIKRFIETAESVGNVTLDMEYKEKMERIYYKYIL